MDPATKERLKIAYLKSRGLFFNGLSKLLHQKKAANLELSGIKKIIVIRIDRIGDLALTTPVFKNLKKSIPNCRLSVLANKTGCALLHNNPNVDDIIIYDPKQNFAIKIWEILKLRFFSFDLAIDLYADYEMKTALIAALIGAKKRIGYSSYGRQLFFNLLSPELRDDEHFIEISLDLLKSIGVRADRKDPEIFLTKSDRQWAKRLLETKTNYEKVIIAIHPGAYYPSQRWLPEYYAEVVNRLRYSDQVDFILLGGQGDLDAIDAVQSSVNGSICMHVTTDIRQFSAILSFCQILVCNNSGPLHIAAAVRTPTISFIGPTNKSRWFPVGSIQRVFRTDWLECIGCQEAYCKKSTHDCMRLIKPAQVVRELKKMMVIDDAVSGKSRTSY